MAMIMCPNCGTSISDRALSCPQCGFVGDDPSRPISQQAIYEMVPRLQVEIDRWDPQSQALVTEPVDIPLEMRRKIFGFLGNLEQLQTLAPGLFQLIKAFSNKDEATLVAHLPEEIMKMVEEGKLFFKEDSNGRILPQVFDARGKFYKQVRLDWEKMPSDVMDTMRHLQTQIAIAMVLAEVHSLRDQIEGIRVDLQNDRLALAEGAWDKLMQARAIEDSRLRDALIVQAISSATEAKRTLMRNFAENVKYLKAHSNERLDKKLISAVTQQNQVRAADAFNDLAQITNAVRVEGVGYAMLNQNGASIVCLEQFREFIDANKLNERDTLLSINSHLPAGSKMPDMVERFEDLALRITALDGVLRLNRIPEKLLEPFRPEPEIGESNNAEEIGRNVLQEEE
ncbi:hypothetical protein BIGA_0475 [Bifidobacterium pullorum subsp. gallinarum]|uniref:Putative zinc-ribbon domain-containing protein n=1 Tax=Bifidobacterium pullorum subsp. gallinarum TaxID=78344 RepID=A0A087AQJ7_9BIFI|nr:zinc ribbon domain-containing protein [Bifidobacterium pullorum]KFI61047.1 hypothetical protein BIGA_0475 [Bifidobacterium pullorum subsp. gallinarum]